MNLKVLSRAFEKEALATINTERQLIETNFNNCIVLFRLVIRKIILLKSLKVELNDTPESGIILGYVERKTENFWEILADDMGSNPTDCAILYFIAVSGINTNYHFNCLLISLFLYIQWSIMVCHILLGMK